MVIRNQRCSVRHIARPLHRSSSTTREIKLITAWPRRPTFLRVRESAYNARAADVRTRRQRFKTRRCSKLLVDTVLFGAVHHFLYERWSPSQIADTRKRLWPDGPQLTFSHETIYN